MTEVAIGTAIVAYIEPHEGQAEAFNRWYERDQHVRGHHRRSGAFAGARWVATRACKAVRPAAQRGSAIPRRGSFLTTVWLLEGSQSEWTRGWAGRWSTCAPKATACSRVAIISTPRCTASYAKHGAPKVRRRRRRSTIRLPGSLRSRHPWVRARPASDAVVGTEVPVAVVLTRERVLLVDTEAPAHDLVLGFTAGDPIDAWHARVAPVLASLPGVGFASPFIRTIPGTDAYIGDL